MKETKDTGATFNIVEEIVFASSIYARTRYQLKDCKLSPAEQAKFMQEIMNSNIITNAITMAVAIITEQDYATIQSSIGDIRNRKVSDESMDSVIQKIQKAGVTLN